MPVNPLFLATLRRNWQLFGAAIVLLILVVLHAVFFVPTERRYARAVKSLGGVDAVLDPSQGPPPVPPRVFAMIAQNAMTEEEMMRRSASGQLTVMMLQELSALASRSGLTVTLSEPGLVAPLATRTEARVHLRIRGNYRQLVSYLRALETSGQLYDLERYQIAEAGGTDLIIDLFLIRIMLKQPGGAGTPAAVPPAAAASGANPR